MALAAVPPPAALGGATGRRGVELAGRLQPPARRQDVLAFEFYKHCAGFVGTSERFSLPPALTQSSTADSTRPFGPSVTERASSAASRRTAVSPRGQLVLLFDGVVAAAACGDAGVAILDMSAGGARFFVDCKGHVLSVCEASTVRCGGGRNQAMLLASTAQGGVIAIALARDPASAAVIAKIRAQTVPSEAPSEDAWLLSGYCERGPSGLEVRVLLYRILGFDGDGGGLEEVEVQALLLPLDDAGPSEHTVRASVLAALRGSRPPAGGSWCGPRHFLLAAAGTGYACAGSPWPTEEDTGLVTCVWLPAEPEALPQAATWALPRGELLGAWPEGGGNSLSVLVVGGSRGAATELRLSAASASSEVVVEAWEEVPGFGACATVRAGCWVAASPSAGCFALVEAKGTSAVNVFRRPAGAPRAATAAVFLGEVAGACGWDGEVLGVALSDSAVVAWTTLGLVRATLNLAAQPPAAPAPKVAAKLPMGLDREALLRMLDMQADD